MTSLEKIINKLNTASVAVRNAGIGEQAYLLSKINTPIFFVVPDAETGFKISEQLHSLKVENTVLVNFDNEFVTSKYHNKDNQYNIINALMKIIDGKVNVIITTVEGLELKLSDVESFKNAITEIKVGNCYNIDELLTNLIQAGYKRVDVVEQIGEFALRGDLLDIYSCNHENPIRINFFDDEVESIIYYDNVNLVRLKSLEELRISPNKLIIFNSNDFDCVNNLLENLIKECNDNALYDIKSELCNISGEYLPLFDKKSFHLYDYLDKPLFVYSNLLTLETRHGKYVNEVNERIGLKFKSDKIKSKLYAQSNLLNKNKCLYFDNSFDFENIDVFDLKSKRLNDYKHNLDLIKTDFPLVDLQSKTIKLCLDNENTLKSIKEILFNKGVPFSTNENNLGIVLTTLKYPYNVCISDEVVWYVGATNFAHKKEIVAREQNRIKYLPKSGEYVVHEVHGIGLCEGVVTLKVMGADKDFFKIAYSKGDILYVPTENTNNLSLYMGGSEVKLNKLGGKEFALTKQRTEKAVEEMAKDLLELYAKRAQSKGYKYSEDNYLMTEFESSFEHTETADQFQAIEDIKRDMISGKVMDRLICGDVGYGKTEVAVRAAFKAFLDGKQTAVLAPTTILSLQHYMTFVKRCKDFGVRVEMLNRFKTPKEKDVVIQKLKNGEIDIVCGTHSILSDSVDFKDLGLLILDEEQRFGVKAKEKLKNLKNNVNVISMSATPIPRTLNMAMLTLRDISIINTPPSNRLPVKTYVSPFDMSSCAMAIKKEIDRNGQVLIVYNNIERIFTFASQLMKEVNNENCRFDVVHGKMSKAELENAIKRLYDGKTNVFVSTTLIENGVDLPKANTLIVIDSQNLGLSQMYQLRGRVGRSSEQAYAYFTYPKDRTITIEATERLEALAENTELGSGFKIAMRDLQLRGAGELLGKEQHGHMIKVGYDLYVRLLNEATKRLKGEKTEVIKEVKLDIAISAKVPNDFVSDETEKLKIYSKISNISGLESQKEVIAGLKSSYGKLPSEVLQLTNVALLKALAQKLKIKHIVIDKNNYKIEYYKEGFDAQKVLKMLTKFNKISLVNGELPTIKLKASEFSPITAQGYFIEFLNAQFA